MNFLGPALALSLSLLPAAASAQMRGASPQPVQVPYEEGTLVPPGARVVNRARAGMIVSGASVFGTLWLFSAMLGTVGSSQPLDTAVWMSVPIVGPFVYASRADGVSETGAFLLTVDGVLQGAALVMLIAGATHPVPFLSYDRAASSAPRWTLTPGFAGGPGASLRVTF